MTKDSEEALRSLSPCFLNTLILPQSFIYQMRDRNNPIKNIPLQAFTVIQASHTDFHRDLADIPVRYPVGRITYINGHQFIPLIALKDEHQNRLDHLEISTLDELLTTIEADSSAILLIEYHLSWFKPDKEEEIFQFNEVCRNRARKGGPVVVITAIMDRALLKLDGKADYFFQVGKRELKGRALANKEQTNLDSLPVCSPGPVKRGRLYGQMKLGEW